jgi:hypothetical protein
MADLNGHGIQSVEIKELSAAEQATEVNYAPETKAIPSDHFNVNLN